MYFTTSAYEESYKIQRQDHVSTEELLERADMKPTIEEVKQRRLKMIGHILRQDQNNDCNIAMTWTPEGKRRRGRPKTTWRRTVEKERAEASEAGWRSWEEAKTIAASRDKLCEGLMCHEARRG